MSLLDDFAKFEEEAKELEKKTEELKKEIKEEEKIKEKPIKSKPRIKREDKYQKQIDNLMKEFKTLKNSVLKQKEIIISEEKPVIDAIIKKYSEFNFTEFKEKLMKDFNIKKYDKFVKLPDGKERVLFWSLKEIQNRDPNVKNDTTRWLLIRLINRFYRGDKQFYEFVFDYMKKFTLDLINNYS